MASTTKNKGGSKKSEVKWRNSKARYLLHQDLISGRIPLDSTTMDAPTAYKSRPEFGKSDEEKWKGRLADARKQIEEKKLRAERDSAALSHDMSLLKNHETAALGHGGRPPRWEGSRAQYFLREDMAAEKHKMMRPSKLRETRQEYEVFPKRAFALHITQEARRQNFDDFVELQKQKKLKKLC